MKAITPYRLMMIVGYMNQVAVLSLVSMIYLPKKLLSLALTIAKVMNEDQRISVCKTSVSQIYTILRTAPQEWRSYLTLGRSVIAHIDNTTFMQQPRRSAEQSWMIGGLQRLAFADNGNGEVQDISNWCTRQWMAMFQREPQNVEALRGIGRAWLARAQPALTRIHRIDGSSSSSGGSSQWSAPSISSSEDERQSAAAAAEAERRAGTSDYVEARGFLQPAIEYFERAIATATAQRILSGDLLATVRLLMTDFRLSERWLTIYQAAEAYMSLGNASSPRTNEQQFRRALQLLRAATAIPGYTLGRYLQQ